MEEQTSDKEMRCSGHSRPSREQERGEGRMQHGHGGLGADPLGRAWSDVQKDVFVSDFGESGVPG